MRVPRRHGLVTWRSRCLSRRRAEPEPEALRRAPDPARASTWNRRFLAADSNARARTEASGSNAAPDEHALRALLLDAFEHHRTSLSGVDASPCSCRVQLKGPCSPSLRRRSASAVPAVARRSSRGRSEFDRLTISTAETRRDFRAAGPGRPRSDSLEYVQPWYRRRRETKTCRYRTVVPPAPSEHFQGADLRLRSRAPRSLLAVPRRLLRSRTHRRRSRRRRSPCVRGATGRGLRHARLPRRLYTGRR